MSTRTITVPAMLKRLNLRGWSIPRISARTGIMERTLHWMKAGQPVTKLPPSETEIELAVAGLNRLAVRLGV